MALPVSHLKPPLDAVCVCLKLSSVFAANPSAFACFVTTLADDLIACKTSPGLGSALVFRVTVGLDAGGST